MKITFNEKVLEANVSILKDMGYTTLADGAFIRQMPELYERDEAGKIVKKTVLNKKGKEVRRAVFMVHDATKEFFTTLKDNQDAIGFIHRLRLPGGQVLFGTPLIRSAFMTNPEVHRILGFDPRALVVNQCKQAD